MSISRISSQYSTMKQFWAGFGNRPHRDTSSCKTRNFDKQLFVLPYPVCCHVNYARYGFDNKALAMMQAMEHRHLMILVAATRRPENIFQTWIDCLFTSLHYPDFAAAALSGLLFGRCCKCSLSIYALTTSIDAVTSNTRATTVEARISATLTSRQEGAILFPLFQTKK